jgi:hypothetical protein
MTPGTPVPSTSGKKQNAAHGGELCDGLSTLAWAAVSVWPHCSVSGRIATIRRIRKAHSVWL